MGITACSGSSATVEVSTGRDEAVELQLADASLVGRFDGSLVLFGSRAELTDHTVSPFAQLVGQDGVVRRTGPAAAAEAVNAVATIADGELIAATTHCVDGGSWWRPTSSNAAASRS